MKRVYTPAPSEAAQVAARARALTVVRSARVVGRDRIRIVGEPHGAIETMDTYEARRFVTYWETHPERAEEILAHRPKGDR